MLDAGSLENFRKTLKLLCDLSFEIIRMDADNKRISVDGKESIEELK